MAEAERGKGPGESHQSKDSWHLPVALERTPRANANTHTYPNLLIECRLDEKPFMGDITAPLLCLFIHKRLISRAQVESECVQPHTNTHAHMAITNSWQRFLNLCC